MSYGLTFETLLNYDAGVPGISIDVELRVGVSSIDALAKVDTGSDRAFFQESAVRDLDSKLNPASSRASALLPGRL